MKSFYYYSNIYFVGVVMALVQAGFIRRLPTNKIKTTAIYGLWLIIPSFISVGLAQGAKLLYFGLFLFAICKLLLFSFIKLFTI